MVADRTKKKRLEVRIEQELLDAVNEKSDELHVTNSWIIRTLIQNHIQDLSLLPYNVRDCTASPGQRRTTPDNVRSPDPARARDTVSLTTTTKKEVGVETTTTESASDAVLPEQLAGLLRELDWYGAKFTSSSTEAIMAEKLIDRYPDVDHILAAKEASDWLLTHPRGRKKYAARFLLGWWKRALDKPPWAGPPQGTLDLTTEAGKAQSRVNAGWDETFKPRPTLDEAIAAHEEENAK